MIATLDYLEEQSRAIFQRLSEDLQKVAFVIVVDEDLLSLQHIDILLHLHVDVAEASSQVIVIGVWDFVKEDDTACFHPRYRLYNVFSPHCNVLNAWTTVVVAEFLDLTLFHASGRLVDGHLDLLIEVSHDYRPQRRVIRVDHLVVDRPKTMEIKHALVPLGHGLHLAVFLVPDAMVDIKKVGHGHQAIQRLAHVMGFVARQEWAIVIDALDEGVDRVAVRLDACNNDTAVLVAESGWLANAGGAPRDSLVVDASGVVDSEGDVLDAIAVLGVVR